MKHLILFCLFAAALSARPAVETLHNPAFNQLLRDWRHAAVNPPEPLIVKGADLKPLNLPGDVLLWERYAAQPLTKGDLFVFSYAGSDTCREIGSVGTGYVKTLAGTQVKLADIHGIVRRVIRLID